MRQALELVLAAAVTLVALCCEIVSAKSVPHFHRYRHERSHRRFQHLQDRIDSLDLRQRIDHIHLTNLQKALKEVQERDAASSRSPDDFGDLQKALKKAEERNIWPSKVLDDFMKEKDLKANPEVSSQKALKKGEERDVWPSKATPDFDEKNGKERVIERAKENIEVNDQERSDEMLLLRQELAALRSEVRVLKEERAAEFGHRSSHSIQQEHREAVTASWVVDNVRRLQEAVVEMQEAVNVTAALHDKQEVESRLSVVGRDLAVLRSSLSSVTSKAEAAMATVETVREDLVRTAEDSNHARGRVEALGLEVSGIREEFNGLLSALPDGLTVRGLNATTGDSSPWRTETAVHKEGTSAAESDSSAHPKKPRNTLKPLGDDLGGASVTKLEHELPGRPYLAPPTEEGRQLEKRVRATESGLGEVKASSIQLLDALESLEAQVEVSVAEVRQEVAKMEYRMTAMQDSANFTQVPSNRVDIQALTDHINLLEGKILAIEGSAKISRVPNKRSDIQRLNSRVDQLENKLSAIQDSAKNSPVPNSYTNADFKAFTSRIDRLALFMASVDSRSISECRSKQLALDQKLNKTLIQIEALERVVKKS